MFWPHSEQDVDPALAEKEPTGHASQVNVLPEPACLYPAIQVQVDCPVRPFVDENCDRLEQAVHTVDALTALYVSRSQGRHEVDPALPLYDPARQAEHVSVEPDPA